MPATARPTAGPAPRPPAPAAVADTALTRRGALELAASIRAREITSREVVEAHIAVLERIRPLNALAVERFEAARAEADAADAAVAAATPDLPVLHGVPVTVKELLAVEGMPHTGGFRHRRRWREPADAPAVARLRAAGAVVLGLGNTPGPVYWFETNNWLYGRTANAYDPRRTAGGSSGGDGAVVGSGGAPIALGSDMAGSIRIPAFMNGVFGHLPSPGLVPITGHFPIPDGEFRRTLYVGPLTRRAADLEPVLRLIAGPDGVDPNVHLGADALGDPAAVSLAGLPVKLARHASTLPLRAEIAHGVEAAASALTAAGAQVTELPLRQLRWAFAQFAATAWAEIDLLASWTAITAPPSGSTRRPPLVVSAPAQVLRLAELAPARLTRTLATRRLVGAARRASDAVAGEIGDGVLLYPPFPRLAPRHRTTALQPWLAANTAVFNMLGLPATQVPVGIGPSRLPLGVQVVAAAGHDAVTIAVALELERALGGWVDPAEVRAGRTS